MSEPMKVFVAIAAVGIVAYTYAAPGGHGGGAPMGGMGRADMSLHDPQANSGHAQDLGSSPTQLLNQNTKLATNLQKLLPSGMSAQQACTGFRNLGSCVAAVHIAHNLKIPFADLKPKVTGSGALTLGKAIHALRPDADAKRETRKAEDETRDDLRTAQS